ncbi:metallophosphoesterase family protein [Mesorhizobium sp. KR2-14]|uniref:metallophosphoesterase family protein n=1 Tax=Mesorhizobium sp. KR2-14 TaxID=3156610 RepID=UPI0032B5FA40
MNILGVISDTHGLLREDAVALLQGVDHIVHAGDIGNPTIIERLERVAPVSAIRGNVDVEPWFPDTLQMTLFGQKIFVIHDRKDMTFAPARMGINLVISGHSHRASIESRDDVIYLNPGSAGPRRFGLPITLAMVQIIHGRLVPKIYEIASDLY